MIITRNKGEKKWVRIKPLPSWESCICIASPLLSPSPLSSCPGHREMNQRNQVITTQPKLRAMAPTAQPTYSLSDLSDTRKKELGIILEENQGFQLLTKRLLIFTLEKLTRKKKKNEQIGVSQKSMKVRNIQAQSCYQLPQQTLEVVNKDCYVISLNRFIF